MLNAEVEDVPPDDLSTLSWVHGELRRSLDNANKALRRHLKEAEAQAGSDLDRVDPAVLRGARAQIHQSVGALEMIGLPGPARVLRASEAAVQRFVAKPQLLTAAAAEAVESASFGVLDYLGRKLAGKGVPTLALFPQYLKLQQLAGADRVHPADLWREEWQWQALPADASAAPRTADAAARDAMETQVLAMMRAPDRAAMARMSDLCAGLGAGTDADGPLGQVWQLAAAFYDAQAGGLLDADVYTKRISSRLLAQLRMALAGQREVSDRLALDLLFFCAHARAPDAAEAAPRLAAVRAAYAVDESAAFDYLAVRLGRFDPALIAQARKRVAGATEQWSAVAGGEAHRAGGLAEQFALVGESLKRLYPSGEILADALQRAVAQTLAAGTAPSPALAMEVATSVLYLDASLEDGEFDQPLVAGRVQRLAQRIRQVGEGRAAQPLEPWMEELYRRVSDRQTMGSVVQELRASLSEVEKQIDQYFRDPAQRELLIPVPAQLQSMRGVLSVLDLEHASQAVLRMRDDVDRLSQAEIDLQGSAHQPAFDRLADNLGALGFLIDMLSVQPQMARALFRFDAAEGRLRAVMGRRASRLSSFGGFDEAAGPAPELVAQAQSLAQGTLPDADLKLGLQRLSQQALLADQRALAETMVSARAALDRAGDDAAAREAARASLAQAVADLAQPAPGPEPAPQPAAVRLTPPPAAGGGTGLEDDAEMREIFIEEAREVLQGAHDALARLAAAPGDLGDLTLIRRACHTLKGSARMVGLGAFGEAAWACERLYNARLAENPQLDAELRRFTERALGELGDWVEAIAAGRPAPQDGAALIAAADALHPAPMAAAPMAAVPMAAASIGAAPALPVADIDGDARAAAGAALRARVPDLPSAEDLQLDFGAPQAEPAAAAPIGAARADFGFELDLGSAAAPAAADPAAADPAAADAFALDFGAAAAAAPTAAPPPAPARTALPEVAELDELPDLADLADLADLSGLPDPHDLPAQAAAAQPGSGPSTLEADAPAWAHAAGGASPGLAGVAAAGAFAGEPAAELDLEPDEAEASSADAIYTSIELELPSGFDEIAPAAQPAAAAAGEEEEEEEEEEEAYKQIGDLRIGIPLFNIYLNEADELSRRLCTDLAEWGLEAAHRPVDEATVALAHKLAGSSATVGYVELSTLARALEHALARSRQTGHAGAGEPELFSDVADEIRQLLHQFAAGFLRVVPPVLRQRLARHELELTAAEQAAAAATSGAAQPGSVTVFEADADADADADAVAAAEAKAEAEAGPQAGQGTAALSDADAAAAAALPAAPAGAVAPAVPPAGDTLGSAALTAFAAAPMAAGAAPCARADAFDDEHDLDAVDALDEELFPIFREEGEELLPQLQARMRDWAKRPEEAGAAAACMRTLHTFKGGARLAGAMRLGEMAHRLETAIEHLLARGQVEAADVEALLARVDSITTGFEQLGQPAEAAPAIPAARANQAAQAAQTAQAAQAAQTAETADAADAAVGGAAEAVPAAQPAGVSPAAPAEPPAAPSPPAPMPAAAAPPAPPRPPAAAAASRSIDWSRFAAGSAAAVPQPAADRAGSAQAAVRVRAPLLDRLVNQAGEVSITRARIESDVGQIRGSLGDLTENLDRLRRQLRDLELQAESQIASRMEAAKAAAQAFDPLEMDRFTRFQELTRMMAESVNDVATVHRGLQRSLQATEDELASQARLTRDLQDDLLRTRMVEFESLADRLYRVVRQAAKETGKQVRLDIAGGAIEVDRGVLDRMTAPFEHLLRNSVAHGIEAPAQRLAAGKDAAGAITISLAQEGNEVAVEFRDDGAGLDLDRIRRRAVAQGLLAEGAQPGDAELANLIFAPGFSTADNVSELAGRGVGMDVVRAEVNAMGGRIETATAAGQGASFRLVLPLTTAVTQVVMLRCGGLDVAVPSTLVEQVRRVPAAELEQAYAGAGFAAGERVLPFFWLGALLRADARGPAAARMATVVIVRSAAQRVALHVDEVLGNQEVVVKNLGPQLARLPGLAGVTLLPSGAVALIYNPVALAATYGDAARAAQRRQPAADQPAAAAPAEARAPLVLVVDDSLTVRRVTQRLLEREGYRVALAKDGLDALEKLADELPAVVLSDIEMPRMDGFDLVRNLRADARLAQLPVIMITSRIAQKHRDYAARLGVDHYLGKPYAEDELLSLVARCAQEAAVTA